jgi:hypothetical protein
VVLLLRRDIISMFVLWTLAVETDMPLVMIKIAIVMALCKPCCENLFAMSEVAIRTENVVIPALGVGIYFNGVRLKYPPEYFVQHLSVCLPQLIQPLLRNITVLDWNRQESAHSNGMR